MTSVPDRIRLPENKTASEAISALADAGHQARFAGGIVRDCLLGRPLGDTDLATTAPPALVMQTLEQAGLKVIPTGIEHGTVTAVGENTGEPVEVTTLRRDIETDGRHAVVKFGTDWIEDARRRDFTMNALFADADGTLHDFVGGVEDALAGRVRFVGDPDIRVREDYLRILRFFRFHALLGRIEPEGGVLESLARHVPKLASLSAERVTKELMGLLSADDPSTSWSLAERCGVADAIFGKRSSPAPFARLVEAERAAGIGPVPARRLSLLTDGLVTPRLVLPNAVVDHLRAVSSVRGELNGNAPPDEGAVRVGLYRQGRSVLVDGILTCTALASDWNLAVGSAAARFAQTHPVPEFPISGQNVVDMGVPPGPAVGELLRRVEDWWIENGFEPDRASCLDRLRDYSTRTV